MLQQLRKPKVLRAISILLALLNVLCFFLIQVGYNSSPNQSMAIGLFHIIAEEGFVCHELHGLAFLACPAVLFIFFVLSSVTTITAAALNSRVFNVIGCLTLLAILLLVYLHYGGIITLSMIGPFVVTSALNLLFAVAQRWLRRPPLAGQRP